MINKLINLFKKKYNYLGMVVVIKKKKGNLVVVENLENGKRYKVQRHLVKDL